jgi:hypothetical protein
MFDRHEQELNSMIDRHLESSTYPATSKPSNQGDLYEGTEGLQK